MFTDHSGSSLAPASWRRDLLLLALAFGLLFAFRLGSYPLSNPDEGRYAEIPREMVASGDWVTPRLDGVNYFEKPPLVYWTTALCLKFFGPSEWSMRATPALFALAGVLLTYGAARKLHGRMAGLGAAVVLGTSILWFVLGRIMLLDMAVSVLMSATLFCFILAVNEPAGATRRWLFYGLYASAALATLTKGLIGFLVTGAVMFLWLLIFNQWKRLRPMHLPSGIALFLVIAAPWHALAALHNDTWTHRYFVYEHWERFTSPAASRPGAWWYFVLIVLGGLIPWSGFLWPAVRDAVRGGWAKRGENGVAWFLLTWAGFIFLFFSKSHSKLAPYILPIFPALAVLVGAWLARLPGGREGAARARVGFGVFAFFCGLLATALVVVVMRPTLVRMGAAQAAALQVPAFVMAAVLLTGGILAPWLAKLRGVRPAVGLIVATMAVFFGTLMFAAADISKPGTKALALMVKAQAKPGDRVLHYHEFFHDFTFYAERLVDVVAFKGELELEEDAAARASGRFMDEPAFRKLWTGPGRVWAVARKKDLKELFGDATFRYHLIGESPDHIFFSNQL
ncbi:MAG: glycosyltransferase family 39 protein [Undibacterium sp.]|nr:glycosyltransferase family 39 protein [Opitutaceae bacterium]